MRERVSSTITWFTNIPIKRKLTTIILLTSTVTLLLAGVAMVATELVTARQAMVEDMTVMADVLGRYSGAALSFHREEDTEEVKKNLSAVDADPHVLAACVYDKDNHPFGQYVRAGTTGDFPASPPPDGYRFMSDRLEVAHGVDWNQKRIGTIYLQADLRRIYSQLSRHAAIVGLVLLGAILVTLLLSARLHKPIADPILALSDLARRVAENKDYTVRAVRRGPDETGLLTDSFNQMLGEIEIAQSSLQRANQSMQEQTREIVETIHVLVSMAGQILATSIQLAAGASETATSVNQATVTVGEVRQTAEMSNQQAKVVSETAQRTAQISRDGTKSTEEVVDGMNRIRQHMNSIADSMVRLGEQSQTIGQIVATVEDLAAQSNILAVNAAIEAAKAGEQGKGFSVVAQEVRSLAEQSRQATNQVRGILADVQRATSAAVMATEQGAKAVDAGVIQSGKAGESIQTLARSVTYAAEAASQIAASSQQQLAGVDQVASAMENINRASAQNVTSAVQLETAAQNLKELGHKLKQTLERYQH